MTMAQNGYDMPPSPDNLIFLKLGGSLITQKDEPETPRPETIARLAQELRRALERQPLTMLIGHGSGSFGHAAAARLGVHQDKPTLGAWGEYAEIWRAAHRLHMLVLKALWREGLPAISYPPSVSALAEGGRLISMAHAPIQRSLESGLLPITMGDVVFDDEWGAVIVSTEQVFAYLAGRLRPRRVLLAGSALGVLRPGSRPAEIYEILTRRDFTAMHFDAPPGADVTGGMASKVEISLDLAERLPGAEVRIFSAEEPDALLDVLIGGTRGTRIVSGPSSSEPPET
ncbi:MAG TPA: isopentenyl phosphate kinase family protein [Chloroflexi bacterium]|nr:isopentenyl phosphate kinase family protein [Chloroflexota bacterium]